MLLTMQRIWIEKNRVIYKAHLEIKITALLLGRIMRCAIYGPDDKVTDPARALYYRLIEDMIYAKIRLLGLSHLNQHGARPISIGY